MACEPAGVRSLIQPRKTNWPRSLMRAVTEPPFRVLVTCAMVPNGSDLCAAVKPAGVGVFDVRRFACLSRPMQYRTPRVAALQCCKT